MSRSLSVAFLLVAVMAASGCDQARSSFAPQPVSSSPLPSPAGSTGATITGTVDVVTFAQSAQSAQFAGQFAVEAPIALTTTVMVCVDGAAPEICVEVDALGNFTLTGDFTGDVHLHFFGSGYDVRLIIHDVYSDEVVTIRVELNGDYGTLPVESRERGRHPSDPNSVEVKGVVSSILSGTCPDDDLTFEVNGIVVNTDGETVSKSGTCYDVEEGVHVKVQGFLLTGTTPTEIQAVEVKSYLDDDYSEPEEGSHKVLLCHRTGNSGYHTIQVSADAVPTHLAHGDTRGACGWGHRTTAG